MPRHWWHQRASTSTGQQPAINGTGFTGLGCSLWLPWQLMYFTVRPVSWDGGWLFSFSPSYHELCGNLWHWRGIFCRLKCTQNVHNSSVFSFLCSQIQFLLSPYLSEQDCDPGHSCERLCDMSGTTAWSGSRGFGSLPQGKYTLTMMDGGADLKYRCAMVCGIHGRIMHGSNTESMKLTDMGIRSGRENKCGI